MTKTGKSRNEQILEQISKIQLVKTVDLQDYIVPRGKSIIVERSSDFDNEQKTTESGLIMPETAGKSATNIGVVVAVGNEVPEDINIGSVIYFNQNCNLEVMIKGKMYLKMHEIDAYFILNPQGKVTYLTDKNILEHDRKYQKNVDGVKENNRIKNEIRNDTSKFKATGKVKYSIAK